MINLDNIIKENIKEHNRNWPQSPDHSQRISVIGGSGFGKRYSLFNSLSHQPIMDTIYSYSKDTYEAKYQFLMKKRESTRLKHLNDSKAFIKYLNYMVDAYKN